MGGAKRGPMCKMAQMFGLGGGMPQPTPEEMEALQKQAAQGGAVPTLPEMPSGLFRKSPRFPGTLPGLGGSKLPGLGGDGFNPFGEKKK